MTIRGVSILLVVLLSSTPVFVFAQTSISAGALLGKSATYVETYTQAYRQNAKRRRLQAAFIGFGVSSVIGVLAGILGGNSTE